MEFQNFVLTVALSCFAAHVLTTSVDHNLFMKQIHLQELGIQINHLHEKLYEHCPTDFQTPNIGLIIGRRSSDDASLDLKIELAEKTLGYLIQKFANCTRSSSLVTLPDSTQTNTQTTSMITTTKVTPRTSTATQTNKQMTSMKTTIKVTPRTSTAAQTTSTKTTIHPTTSRPRLTTSYPFRTTTYRSSDQHAFQVLRSQNTAYNGSYFLVLEVRVPTNGLSKSSDWCEDYQYLCEEFHRRPTGCGRQYRYNSYYTDCREKYSSAMNSENVLSCNPSDTIALLANIAFPHLHAPARSNNSFGFHECRYCSRTIQGSGLALTNMNDFWESGGTTFYTVCR